MSGLQVLASQCLTALCASAGGGDGCTVAEQPEIDVLLDGLLSSCFSVRDAALRVSRNRNTSKSERFDRRQTS